MIIYKRLIVISLILLFVPAKIGMAEPTPTIQYLMNEPVSLLDLGILRLTLLLDEMKPLFEVNDKYKKIFKYSILTGVDYDWGSNRIELEIHPIGECKSKQEAKDWCISVIKKIRFSLAIDSDSGKPLAKDGLLDSFFTHNGFAAKSEPANIKSELEKIILISIGVPYIEKEKTKYLRCESPLLGTKVFFSE